MNATALLRSRADSYSRDATALRQSGDKDSALVYETVRDELRKVAGELDAESERAAAEQLDQALRAERARELAEFEPEATS